MSDDDQRNRQMVQNLFLFLRQFLISNEEDSEQDDNELSSSTSQEREGPTTLNDLPSSSSSSSTQSKLQNNTSQTLLHQPLHIEQLQIAGSSSDRLNHSLFRLLFNRAIGNNSTFSFNFPHAHISHSLTVDSNRNNVNNVLNPTQSPTLSECTNRDTHSETTTQSGINPNINQSITLPPFTLRSSPFSERTKRHIMGRFLPFKQAGVLDKHDDQVFCGIFSKDGTLFLSACQDRCIRLFNTSRWKLIKEIIARDVGWSIISVDYSPNKEWLIYSSWSDYVHICNTSGQHEVHEALNFRRSILGGSSDCCLYFYDLDRRERTHRVRAHTNDVNAVAFIDNTSQVLCSGSDDALIKIWDRRTLNKGHVGVLPGHIAGITFIDSKGDGRYIISNGKDQCIKLWDLRKMKSDANPIEEYFDYRIGIVPQTKKSLLKDGDCSLMTYRGHQVVQTLIRCRFSPLASTGQQYIYSGSFDGTVYVYDVLTGQVKLRLSGHQGTVRDVHWHPYEPVLLSTSWDGTVKKWHWTDDEQSEVLNVQSDTNNNRPRRRYFTIVSDDD